MNPNDVALVLAVLAAVVAIAVWVMAWRWTELDEEREQAALEVIRQRFRVFRMQVDPETFEAVCHAQRRGFRVYVSVPGETRNIIRDTETSDTPPPALSSLDPDDLVVGGIHVAQPTSEVAP